MIADVDPEGGAVQTRLAARAVALASALALLAGCAPATYPYFTATPTDVTPYVTPTPRPSVTGSRAPEKQVIGPGGVVTGPGFTFLLPADWEQSYRLSSADVRLEHGTSTVFVSVTDQTPATARTQLRKDWAFLPGEITEGTAPFLGEQALTLAQTEPDDRTLVYFLAHAGKTYVVETNWQPKFAALFRYELAHMTGSWEWGSTRTKPAPQTSPVRNPPTAATTGGVTTVTTPTFTLAVPSGWEFFDDGTSVASLRRDQATLVVTSEAGLSPQMACDNVGEAQRAAGHQVDVVTVRPLKGATQGCGLVVRRRQDHGALLLRARGRHRGARRRGAGGPDPDAACRSGPGGRRLALAVTPAATTARRHPGG